MLRGAKIELEERDLGKDPLSVDELKALFKGRKASDFINPRNDEAREKGWAKTPPPDKELIEAMARNPNLIRRPILFVDGEPMLGFDAKAYEALVKKQKK